MKEVPEAQRNFKEQ